MGKTEQAESMAVSSLDTLWDIALSPALWLSVGLAVVYGGLFYIWQGGTVRQLGRDLLAGIVGFGLGQTAGNFLRLNAMMVGQVQVIAGTVGAVLALLAGRRLARPNKQTK